MSRIGQDITLPGGVGVRVFRVVEYCDEPNTGMVVVQVDWETFRYVFPNFILEAALSARDEGADQPWPTSSILRELSRAAEILLNEHSYDGHGHENIRHALVALKERS